MSQQGDILQEKSRPRRRWIGVALSVVVPGFGLFRAGAWRRGLLWMLVFYGMSIVGLVASSLSGVPVAVGMGVLLLQPLLWGVMLCDSFRPGRMTWRLWVLLVGLIVANTLVLDPPKLFWLCRAFSMKGSNAMAPTLRGGGDGQAADFVMVDPLTYRFSKPKRGDIIVFSSAGISAFPDGNYYAKRLIGLPGERITIKDNAIYVDDRRLTEQDGIPPIAYFPARSVPGKPTPVLKEGDVVVVKPGEYFVLGDNSAFSLDSRYWGGLPASNVIGKVSKIYYPFSRMGSVCTK